jgi:CBS domain-containing protein
VLGKEAMVTGIGNFCVRNVVTVPRNAPIVEAAKLMREHHVGALVVVDRPGGNVPVGILTDRDIVVEVVAAGLAANTVNVAEIVRRPIVTVNEEASYAETVRLMAQHAVRRMPVVDVQGTLVGIVAVDDLMRQLAGPLLALADLAGRERRYERETRL